MTRYRFALVPAGALMLTMLQGVSSAYGQDCAYWMWTQDAPFAKLMFYGSEGGYGENGYQYYPDNREKPGYHQHGEFWDCKVCSPVSVPPRDDDPIGGQDPATLTRAVIDQVAAVATTPCLPPWADTSGGS